MRQKHKPADNNKKNGEKSRHCLLDLSQYREQEHAQKQGCSKMDRQSVSTIMKKNGNAQDEKKYPSRLISQMMMDDSSEDDDDNRGGYIDDSIELRQQFRVQQQQQMSEDQWMGTAPQNMSSIAKSTRKGLIKEDTKHNKINRNQPPPLTTMRSQSNNESNGNIKYTCYKILKNEQLVEHTPQQISQHKNPHNYNTLNLDEASQIISPSALQTSTHQQQQQNSNYIMLCLIKQKQQTIKQQSNTISQQQQHIKDIILQKEQLARDLEETKSSKQNKGSYPRYDSKNNKQNSIAKQIQYKRDNQSNMEQIEHKIESKLYQVIQQYLQTTVHKLKQHLIKQKMSANVEGIIEDHMEQLLNINAVTVNLINKSNHQRKTTKIHQTAKNHQDSNPTKLSTRNWMTKSPLNNVSRKLWGEQQEQQSRLISRSYLTHTPIKSNNENKQNINNNNKQKNQELRNLQKSLQKLRDMEKSYTKGNDGNNQQSYESLDRSSILNATNISRSKSRRKIFDNHNTSSAMINK